MFDESNIVEVPAGQDQRWQAVAARDRNFDGRFYYAVKTTGVYCRPSCASRVAKPENVSFHLTCADAEQAGFRPCKRCKPDQPALVERHAARVAEICRSIESADAILSLGELARKAGLSAYYFHRLFKTSPASRRETTRSPIVPSAFGTRLQIPARR